MRLILDKWNVFVGQRNGLYNVKKPMFFSSDYNDAIDPSKDSAFSSSVAKDPQSEVDGFISSRSQLTSSPEFHSAQGIICT